MLTADQLNHLKTDLCDILRYEETFQEFLDHYAMLTEQLLTQGNDFENARTLAMSQLGGPKKLIALEEKMLTQWQTKISERGWSTFRDCFRWPAILLTLLTGGIAYLITTYVSTGTIVVIAGCLAFLPLTVDFFGSLIPAWIGYWQGRRDRVMSFRRRGLWQLFVPVNFVFQLMNVTRIFTKDASAAAQQVSHFVAIAVLSFMFIYTFSLFKLYRERLILNQ